MEYIDRIIDKYLEEWKDSSAHKPLLLRGARQVGKSSAVRHLGRLFENFAEVNFERLKSVHSFFEGDIDVRLITAKLSKFLNVDIVPGKTLLFFDEIQECPQAIMALRFFWEELPELHVVAAGSLLEFTLEELPTFGVGRIRSLFMPDKSARQRVSRPSRRAISDIYACRRYAGGCCLVGGYAQLRTLSAYT